jgi:hypothetical protein
MTIRNIGISVALALGLGVGGAHAQSSGGAVIKESPGKVTMADTVRRTAKVVALDPSTRTLTLWGGQGRVVDLIASDEVRNFGQIRVGDDVTVVYTEALTLELKKSRGTLSASGRESALRAAPGQKPAGALGQEVRVLADVVAVDRQNSTVALKGPRGNTVELKVGNPAHLKRVKVGDQVEAVYAQAVAMTITAPDAPVGK